MQFDYKLRAATSDDIQAIAAIYRHHVTHGTGSFETEPPSVEEMLRRQQLILGQGYPYLVADKDAVIGYAYAGAYRPRAAYRDTVEDSVYIHPDMMGRGIGSGLLAAVIDLCVKSGFRQMIAVVGDSSNLNSVRLHEKLGFRKTGTLTSVGYKHGRWLDTVLLQRTLGDGDITPPHRP